MIKLKKSQSLEDAPVKRIRQVLPEHEGPYKITLPAGNTEKTRRLLEQQGFASKKTSVFDRLGVDSVSSTTNVDTPKITVTGLGKKIVRTISAGSSSTVFDRLGDGTPRVAIKRQAATSTVNSSDEEEVCGPPLQYHGVLKSPRKKIKLSKRKTLKKTDVAKSKPTEKKATQKIKVTSSIANVLLPASEGFLAGGRALSKVNIKQRLGPKSKADLLILQNSSFDIEICTPPSKPHVRNLDLPSSEANKRLAQNLKRILLERKAINTNEGGIKARLGKKQVEAVEATTSTDVIEIIPIKTESKSNCKTVKLKRTTNKLSITGVFDRLGAVVNK